MKEGNNPTDREFVENAFNKLKQIQLKKLPEKQPDQSLFAIFVVLKFACKIAMMTPFDTIFYDFIVH